MTKQPMHISLGQHVKDRLRNMSGYEDIEQLNIPTIKGRRADHLAFNRDLIIEQKDFTPSEEHVRNGANLENAIKYLMNKYDVGPDTIPNIHNAISEQESRHLFDLRNKFIRKYVHLCRMPTSKSARQREF